MSRTVASFAANRLGVRPGEKYGLEVEAEGCPVDEAGDMRWSAGFRDYWSYVSDGSLRNGGIEFLSRPLGRTMVNRAIGTLWPYFDEGRINASVRTGIHIHASCLGLTIEQVSRILQVYALVEPALFKYVGPEREENIYCIPWYRAPSEATAARDMLNRYEVPAIHTETEEPCKYSALYVQPLTNFGTIEFRHAPTWTNAETMFRWWQMVQAVWRSHRTEYDVLDKWRELGPVGFARSVLPFEWLSLPEEADFWDADVDAVACRLLPTRTLLSPEWGMPPTLDFSGFQAPPVQDGPPVEEYEGGEDGPEPDEDDPMTYVTVGELSPTPAGIYAAPRPLRGNTVNVEQFMDPSLWAAPANTEMERVIEEARARIRQRVEQTRTRLESTNYIDQLYNSEDLNR